MTEFDDLLFRSGEPFATGVARYLDAFPGLTEPLARIYVKLLPQGAKTAVLALLDTGGHYCILNSEVADSIRNRLTERIGERKLQTALGLVRGELYRRRGASGRAPELLRELAIEVPDAEEGGPLR